MVTSFSTTLNWKLVSKSVVDDCVTYEYVANIPQYFSDSRKYHMRKSVSPYKESIFFSVV